MADRSAGALARDALAGAASGLVASWAMTRAMPILSRLQTARGREKERRAAAGGEGATVATARKAAHLVGRELPPGSEARAGNAVHSAYGAAWGAAWALLRRRAGRLGPLAGVAFGAALWAVSDELLVSALRLAPPPWRYPPSTHVRGLAAHLVYGAATDAGARLAARALG